MLSFETVIATCNRPASLEKLVNQILSCSFGPERVIIVDSSDIKNNLFQNNKQITYIHTRRKNQPYQRFLGCQRSQSDILFFFDDDIEIVDKNCFKKVLNTYNFDESIVGVQPKIEYHNSFLDNKIPKSLLREGAKNFSFLESLKYLSGSKKILPGKMWLAGLRGKLPKNLSKVEWFNGPAFSVKREYLYKNFNFSLFSLYDSCLGKAEDAILGYTISKKGKIIYFSDVVFFHKGQQTSTYTASISLLAKRVAYSRLYLSYEYSRLNKTSYMISFLHFNVFLLGRVLTQIINQFISYEGNRNKLILGSLIGYLLALRDCLKLKKFQKDV